MTSSLLEVLSGIIDTSTPSTQKFEAGVRLLAQDIAPCDDSAAGDANRRAVEELEREATQAKLGAMASSAASNILALDTQHQQATAAAASQAKTAGARWYGLRATPLTPETLAHLKLLHMRALLNLRTFFQRPRGTRKFRPPTFFEMGVELPGPTEHFSAAPKRQRGRTLVEAVLQDRETRQHLKDRWRKFVAARRKFHMRPYTFATVRKRR
jgi:hypothetical protein